MKSCVYQTQSVVVGRNWQYSQENEGVKNKDVPDGE